MIKITRLADTPREELFVRDVRTSDVSGVVAEIIENVRSRGDAALLEYCRRFDGCAPDPLEAGAGELDAAVKAVEPEFLAVLGRAAENIRAFHEAQVRRGFALTRPDGSIVGQKVTPIERVGLYVPGGTAAYPSTVLMNAIPAKIAGCAEIVMVTPAKNGVVSPAILAAAKLAGVQRVFKAGGAQAIAALACGTESVPKVDKIVGPGNAFVAEAKKQVFGMVSIDMIAGPSEILIVADGKTDPAFAAADLLSQAEHDKMASAVLITDSGELARAVAEEVERRLERLPRRDIAAASVESNGKIIVADSLDQAMDLANELAPEHLEICVDRPFDWLGRVKNAGSVFLGRSCPEALGDYLAGPNHTLPTGGTARFSNPLSVDDFVKKTQFTYYSDAAFAAAAPDVALFARREGLEAHAQSAMIRLEGGEQ